MNLEDWISDDYLGRLTPKSEGRFPGRDDNDNGILFLAMMLMLDFKPELFQQVQDSIKRLQVEPGLFKRRSFSPEIYEAHDNYVGICALSVIYGFNFREDIVRYGEKNGWNFNNVEPGKFEMKCQRQGGDIAFYKLAAGYNVEPWYVVWMIGGLIIAAIKNYPSTMNLGWLRFRTLDLVKMSSFNRAVVTFGHMIFNSIQMLRGKTQLDSFKNYFRPDHPIIKLGEIYYGN